MAGGSKESDDESRIRKQSHRIPLQRHTGKVLRDLLIAHESEEDICYSEDSVFILQTFFILDQIRVIFGRFK